MATLIEVRNNNGVIGRCDAKCYEAHEPECNCVCGGRNRGAGLNKEISNTRDMAIEQIKENCPEHAKVELVKKPNVQRGLFE